MTGLRVGAVLSMTGRFAAFGQQAAAGLRVWSQMIGDIELLTVDDGSSTDRVSPAIGALARDCDLLLGPYSTVLARVAVQACADQGLLMWNHGGAGDDVQDAPPGTSVSVLTPTSGYAVSYVRLLARRHPGRPLRLAPGPGRFAEQVVAGAREAAERSRVPLADSTVPTDAVALLVAGTYDHDVGVLQERPRPPVVGSIAAGVQQAARDVDDLQGIYGIAQWLPGVRSAQTIGPAEEHFVEAYRRSTGAEPDYPAVQAAATAAVAAHCRSTVSSSASDVLWHAATGLRARTFYGDFAIDASSGAQVGHAMALGQWQAGSLVPIQP